MEQESLRRERDAATEQRLREWDEQQAAQGRAGIEKRKTWSDMSGIKDSGQRQTYSSGSQRDPSTGKIKWSRITFGPMMRRWAQHLTAAEVKYPDPKPGFPNFMLIETEEELVRYKESAFRHFMDWFDGKDDEDHAAAVFFNINGVEIIKAKQRAAASLRTTGTTVNVTVTPVSGLSPDDRYNS